jgi:hypothetical protein
MSAQEKKLAEKRRGRPATGAGFTIGVRLQPDQLTALDKWIARHPEPKPTRPEAIRRMMVAVLSGDRLLPSRPDLRQRRRSIKVENLNAENDG